ncbi:DUF2919 family protein, partial [Paraglaciecola sp.]|uniref:DUF2919 family protein n=1 Tax=Paraglaciecola sp. TaxID=1920173 RepID=UPI003EFB1B39
PWLFGFVRPLMIVSVLGDFIFHVYFANLSHWQFSWLIAITFILDLLCLYFLLKDRHLLLMVKDWKINPNPKCKKQSVK